MLARAPCMVSGNWDWVGASEGPVWTFLPAHLGSLRRTSRRSSSFSQHLDVSSVSSVYRQLELPTQEPVSEGTGRKKAFLTDRSFSLHVFGILFRHSQIFALLSGSVLVPCASPMLHLLSPPPPHHRHCLSPTPLTPY